MSRDEIFNHLHQATNYWFHYEQHHGSPHVHGFMWFKNVPNMEKLNWDDTAQVIFSK